jgi:hypothetical protein
LAGAFAAVFDLPDDVGLQLTAVAAKVSASVTACFHRIARM